MAVDEDLEEHFPRLKATAYRATSPETPAYNCIAWAAGDTSRWWWPDAMLVAYWPPGAPREDTVGAVASTCEILGYEECEESGVEPGYEKLAIYGVGDQPKHAARQLPEGMWSSKLGQGIDIEHTLDGLESELYGKVVKIMKRPRSV